MVMYISIDVKVWSFLHLKIAKIMKSPVSAMWPIFKKFILISLSFPSSHTPVHGARQSLTTRQRKHLACPSLISLLWMLVLQTKSSALKLDLSVSCKKRNLDLKLLLCVCVCFIFSSSHLSLKETPTKHFANAKSPTQRS